MIRAGRACIRPGIRAIRHSRRQYSVTTTLYDKKDREENIKRTVEEVKRKWKEIENMMGEKPKEEGKNKEDKKTGSASNTEESNDKNKNDNKDDNNKIRIKIGPMTIEFEIDSDSTKKADKGVDEKDDNIFTIFKKMQRAAEEMTESDFKNDEDIKELFERFMKKASQGVDEKDDNIFKNIHYSVEMEELRSKVKVLGEKEIRDMRRRGVAEDEIRTKEKELKDMTDAMDKVMDTDVMDTVMDTVKDNIFKGISKKKPWVDRKDDDMGKVGRRDAEERLEKEIEAKRQSGASEDEIRKKEKQLKDLKEHHNKTNKDQVKEDMDTAMEFMTGVKMSMKFECVMPGTEGSMKFKDVGGHLEAKVELMEVVDFLKNPEKYQNLGAKVPSGALLTGPPGNGKTLLAKAVAGESGVPFISTAGPQFIEKIGGLGAARVRDLFKEARSKAPCIVFIDELDAVGSRNDAGFEMQGAPGGSDEADQVINQLLVELDGMSTKAGEIFVIGATNRDQKVDKALKRAGRLERKIYIDLPTLSEREEIFKLNMLKIKSNFDHTAQANRLALLTPQYSGADVANIVNEAAIEAARLGQSTVEATNFEHAIERVIAGLERRIHSVGTDEIRISAYYEASQALLGWVLPRGDKVLKMSIKPRVQSNVGFVQLEPQLDYLHSKERLLDMVCQGLAGRAGEALFFDKLTNRADSDLKKANDICNKMVTVYGMGECAANLSFPPGPNPKIKPYSNALQREMDAEIHQMLSHAYKRSFDIVTEHRAQLEVLAEALIEKQVLNEDEIAEILKDVPTTRSHKFNKTQGR